MSTPIFPLNRIADQASALLRIVGSFAPDESALAYRQLSKKFRTDPIEVETFKGRNDLVSKVVQKKINESNGFELKGIFGHPAVQKSISRMKIHFPLHNGPENTKEHAKTLQLIASLFANLHTLAIDDDDILPEHAMKPLTECTQLRDLTYSGLQAQRHIPHIIKLPLQRLNLIGCQELAHHAESLNALGAMTTVRELHLPYRIVTNLDFISKMPNLQSLYLSSQGMLKDSELLKLTKNEKLKELGFTSFYFPTAHLHHIALMPQLEKLTFEHCKYLSDKGIQEVAVLPLLKELNVRHSSVNDENMKSFATMPSLEVLILEGCYNLTDACIDSIKQCTKLRFVDLRNTKISQESIQKLQKEKPNLKIQT